MAAWFVSSVLLLTPLLSLFPIFIMSYFVGWVWGHLNCYGFIHAYQFIMKQIKSWCDGAFIILHFDARLHFPHPSLKRFNSSPTRVVNHTMSIRQPYSCARGKKIVPLKRREKNNINGIINCNCAKCNNTYYAGLLTEKQVFLKSHLLFCNIFATPLRIAERSELHTGGAENDIVVLEFTEMQLKWNPRTLAVLVWLITVLRVVYAFILHLFAVHCDSNQHCWGCLSAPL